MQSGKTDQYKEFSQFRDLKDFNNHFEQWMTDLKCKYTKSETIALKRLVRFSASIPGVCYAKIQTIVAATHKLSEMGGISRSTFERMLRKARKFGLIEVINTASKSGRQAHNVYIFKQYQSIKSNGCTIRSVTDSVQNEVANVEKIDVPIESINLSETSNIKNKDIRTEESVRNNHLPIIPSWVNKKFADFASSFFESKQVEELWRIATIHSRINELSSKSLVDVSIEGLRCLVYKYKKGRIKGSMNGYYNGIMRNICKRIYIIDSFNSYFDS